MGKKARCPVCNESFELEADLEVGDTTDCPGCCVELKITTLNPVELEEVVSSNESDEYESEESEDYDSGDRQKEGWS